MRYIIIMLFWYSQLLFAQETSIKVIEIEQLFEEFSDSCYLSQMIIDSERQLIFLGTNEGLFCFKGGEKAYHISKINNIGFSISSFLIANNKLWCGTANGFMFSLDLNTYPNFSTKQYATISNIKENKELKGQGILSMALHKTKLYAGTTEGIIISYEINDTANQINHTKIPNKNLANGNVYSMILHDEPPNIKNKKQNMLVGLADGLFYLQAQKWQAFPIYKPHITPTNNFEYYSKKTPFYISATYKLSQYQDKIWGIGKGNWSEQDNKHILFSLKNPYDKTKLDCDIYMPSSISKNSNMQFNDFQIDTQKNLSLIHI